VSSTKPAVAAPINLPVGQEGTEESERTLKKRKVIAKRLENLSFPAPQLLFEPP